MNSCLQQKTLILEDINRMKIMEMKLLDKEKVVVLWNAPSPAEKNRNFGRFDYNDGE